MGTPHMGYLDLVIYQAICYWEEKWTPNETGSIDGNIFSERERQSLAAILKRRLKQNFNIARINEKQIAANGVVGKMVRDARIERGWRQTDLADDAGVAVSGLSAIESGERYPGDEVRGKLAKSLGIVIPEKPEQYPILVCMK